MLYLLTFMLIRGSNAQVQSITTWVNLLYKVLKWS